MNSENGIFDVNWYLTTLDGGNAGKKHIRFNENNTDERSADRYEEEFASLISEIYYVVGLKNICDKKEGCFNGKKDFLCPDEAIEVKRLNELDEIHTGLISAKRIFFHVLQILQEYADKAPESKDADKNASFEDYHKIGFPAHKILVFSILDDPKDPEDKKLKDFINAIVDILPPKIRDRFSGLLYYFPVINFSKKFWDLLLDGFDKEDVFLLMRLWILFFGFLSFNDRDKFYTFEENLFSDTSFEHRQGVSFVDENLGIRQKDCCLCMLTYNEVSYNSLVGDRKMKVLLDMIKNIEGGMERYVSRDGENCFALLQIDNSPELFFALSGNKEKNDKDNFDLANENLIPIGWHFTQIFLNENVKFYNAEGKCIRYGELKDPKKERKRNYSCCERKLCTKIEDKNDRKSINKIFVKREPCEDCETVLNEEGELYKIYIRYGKENKKEKRAGKTRAKKK